jgi:hypothetical protein
VQILCVISDCPSVIIEIRTGHKNTLCFHVKIVLSASQTCEADKDYLCVLRVEVQPVLNIHISQEYRFLGNHLF